ncbi:hypothetical protein [Novosphingobium sp.]|uniref:hypothetical protein n=1 Tax=Novosphingobium sp. TaxID=1874826 RepID=UPI00333EE032
MMKRSMTAALMALASLPLSACVGEYGPGMGIGYDSGPYAYDGYYDGYYGQVYDGYWGDDNAFYYRRGDGDREYRRGDGGHFAREAPRGQGNYQPLHGSMTYRQGVTMPHFQNRGGNRGGHNGNQGGHHGTGHN